MKSTRLKRIEELKRINRRKALLAKLEGIISPIDKVGFRGLKENLEFIISTVCKTDLICPVKILQCLDFEQLKNDTLELIDSTIALVSLDSYFNVFYFGEYEIESLIIKNVNLDIDYSKLLEVIGYLNGKADLAIVSSDLERGIFIGRTEYSYYEVKIWGIENELNFQEKLCE